jgi:hypothetical protein
LSDQVRSAVPIVPDVARRHHPVMFWVPQRDTASFVLRCRNVAALIIR